MARLYIPLWSHENTFAIGVYSSRREAEDALVDYLVINQRDTYKVVATEVQEMFNIRLEDKGALRSVIFAADDVSDFIRDTVSFSIEKVRVGSLFDFRQWSEWDMDNLYGLLDRVLTGRTGRLY